MSEPLLKVENLVQYFPVSRTYTVKAVNGVSFNIYPGETYGLVGESGSGKTTIGRSIIRLYNPTDGRITFNGKVISGALDRNTRRGEDIHRMRGAKRRAFCGQVQTVFQDPYAALDPKNKVIDLIAEGMDIHHRFANRQEREEKISEMLKKVGLSPEHAARYPHQLSGGMRQRVGIARALIMNPKLIIADECISALDVSVQAQVLNLLQELKEKLQYYAAGEAVSITVQSPVEGGMYTEKELTITLSSAQSSEESQSTDNTQAAPEKGNGTHKAMGYQN